MQLVCARTKRSTTAKSQKPRVNYFVFVLKELKIGQIVSGLQGNDTKCLFGLNSREMPRGNWLTTFQRSVIWYKSIAICTLYIVGGAGEINGLQHSMMAVQLWYYTSTYSRYWLTNSPRSEWSEWRKKWQFCLLHNKSMIFSINICTYFF
jgi:hypothetical protein